MLLRQAPFRITVLSLVSVVLLSACQPKPELEDGAASSASAPASAPQSIAALRASVQRVPVALPDCKGKSCPEFSVERLNSNYGFIDAALDQVIVSSLAEILDIDGLKPDSAKAQQQSSTQANKRVASSDADAASAASSTAVALQPQQRLANDIQPYLDGFLKLDQEMKSLGTSHAISLMIKPAVLDNKAPLVTIVLNTSSYLGGAHGAASQRYFNFDLSREQPISLNDILVSGQKEALRDKAHAVFATWVMDNKLANNLTDYEQAWPFSVSDNFYLAPQGLILQYGEYEIGPYVVGLPRLVIPYNQLQGIIKPQYLPAKAVNQAAAKAAS